MPSTERDLAQEIVQATGRSVDSARRLVASLDADERETLSESLSSSELAIAVQAICDARADASVTLTPVDAPDHQ